MSNPDGPLENVVLVSLDFVGTEDHYCRDGSETAVCCNLDEGASVPGGPFNVLGSTNNLWIEHAGCTGYGSDRVIYTNKFTPDSPEYYSNCDQIDFETHRNLTIRSSMFYNSYINPFPPNYECE